MANHGATIAGSSVEHALLLALNLEKALQAQMLVTICSGARSVIDPALAAQMGSRLLSSRKRTDDLFAYHVRKADRKLGSLGKG